MTREWRDKFLSSSGFLLAGIAVALLLLPLASVATAEGDGRHGGVLRIGYHEPLDNFDVMTTTAVRDEIAQMMLEPLVTMDSELRAAPHLASSWEISDDELSWTFYLREGVEFHDGSPFTSEDVVASFDRFLEIGERGHEFSRIEEWEAIDDYTVRFHLNEPWGAFVETLSMVSGGFVIHPRHIIEEFGGDTLREVEHLVGTGPYMMVEREPEERYRFVRFENYQSPEGEPSGLAGERYQYVDEIIMTPIPDESARLSALLAGEVDIATQLPSDDLPRLQADPNIEASLIMPGRRVYLKMNPRQGPFSDPLLRQAVIAALNLEELMSVQGPPGTWRVNTAVRYQEGQWPWDDTPTREAYINNIERARQLVEESDYDGEPIRYIVTDAFPSMIRHAPLVLERMQEIGLNAEIILADWAGWVDYWLRFGDWEIKASTGGSIAPLSYLDASSRDRGGERWPDFPEAWVEYMNITQREADDEPRKDAVRAMNQISIDYGVEIWIGEVFPVTGARAHVRNIPDFHYARFYNVWLDQ